MCHTRKSLFSTVYVDIYITEIVFTSLFNPIEEEIDGESFVLMSVEDIVSMVKSKGAQLKMIEKKRQLSSMYPAVTNNSSAIMSVSTS